MKQGTYINRLVMLLLFLALAAYLGVYAYQSLRDPFTSTLCYAYTVDDAVEATGWVVRQEVPLPRQEGLVDILPDEGEKVAAGETVAVIYRDAEALDRKGQIRQLELELEQLEYSLRQDSNGSDAARLDQDILAAMVELRGSTAAEDYSRLEENAMELKNLVFRRNYTYSNNTESVESIKAMIKEVSAELSTLKSASSQETTGLRATVPGTYSGQVDGLELVLTPETVMELTPSDLDALKTGGDQNTEGQTGRLITSSRWYFVAPLAEATAARLTEGDKVTVRFSRDFTGDNVSLLSLEGEDHMSLLRPQDAAYQDYLEEVNAVYAQLYAQYNGEIPDELRAEYYANVDKSITGGVNVELMEQIDAFYRAAWGRQSPPVDE